MNTYSYDNLQVREVFHIEFLRAFTKKIRPSFYTLKGGVNMRLFFGSVRYSEDMDMDVNTVSVSVLRDTVMKIIVSASFQNELKVFGIEKILPPDMTKAKQTQTTQRFKIHLITHQGEDLFTKVEFSRRQPSGNAIVESVSEKVLHYYRISPLIISHYDAISAITQKINALVNRRMVQARDIFDLYILSTQISSKVNITPVTAKAASENIFSVSFHQFRDTVLNYLSEEDRLTYDNSGLWDEIKLNVNELICVNHKK
ncbi:MAG: hypothetical protein AUJ85_02015 [Elusimicrobia bacterium CG1_02_37_114]|nr:MAG: hypothetical protein AUJ85_02015 [Elusimicrobia bacterium CG1_02_37_114]PIV53055.1 MAG: hypothetical protein COS17_05890 [Elusimicrobia bacterium CG02_land_8_20_14_3_00_37_13]PIZ12560.1 MAG: hypothetical protein COY53_09425 [Elusimicrobia bacterium CG_4_10_14_0_8_um_filter_37_32]